MVDLKLLLNSYPGCLSNRSTLRAHLLDMFPNEKKAANILASIYECGIYQKMQCMKDLTDHDVQAFINQLDREYGIAPKYAAEYICVWADALDIKYASKPSETSINRILVNSTGNLVAYFETRGFDVVDKRNAGGCLWVIGEKAKLDPHVAMAKELFSITDGGYAKGRATGGRHGWYTSSRK